MGITRGAFFGIILAASGAAAACASTPDGEAPAGETTSAIDQDLVDRDVVAYAEQCKAELEITGPLPDLSCTDGQLDRGATTWDASRLREVPITVDGVPVNATNFGLTLDKGCDRSQWLEERCWTYDLIQRVAINPDVEAVLNCRQKYASSWLGVAERKAAYEAATTPEEKLAAFKLIYEFDDLGYILRNKRTGKSCFFTSYGVSYYGGWIPAPDRKTIPSRDEVFAMLPAPKPPASYDERQWHRGPKGHAELPDNMFFTPAVTAELGGCVGCHNQGAFKHSPFIDQVSAPDVGRIVPANDRTKPYLLVGRAFQKAFRDNKVVEVDTAPGEPGGSAMPNGCVMCHRMSGGGSGAFTRAKWAVGIDPPAMSDSAAAWPARAWMRPGHGKGSEAEYRQAFGADIDRLFCCMKTPGAKGCKQRAIGPTAADVRLDPTGNLDPAAWVAGDGPASCLVE